MNRIADALHAQQSVALCTHISPDGDALGSLFGFAHILKNMGKQVAVFVDGEVSHRLHFMADLYGDSYFTDLSFASCEWQACIALDCADLNRLGQYKELFMQTAVTFNIDHHVTNPNYADFNLVLPAASSAGEVLFQLCESMQISWDKTAASLLYGAIASDTGCFGYANTSPNTHRFAARLMEYGADFENFNVKLFQTDSITALKVRAYAVAHMQTAFNGRVVYAMIDDCVLAELGAKREDTEGVIDVLRSVEGAKVAFFLKKQADTTKVSMRTDGAVNAATLLSAFGGGGHARAAGCTLHMDTDAAAHTVLKALEEWI